MQNSLFYFQKERPTNFCGFIISHVTFFLLQQAPLLAALAADRKVSRAVAATLPGIMSVCSAFTRTAGRGLYRGGLLHHIWRVQGN